MVPQEQHQPIHRVPVNGSSMTVAFFVKLEQIMQFKVGCSNFALSEIRPFNLGMKLSKQTEQMKQEIKLLQILKCMFMIPMYLFKSKIMTKTTPSTHR